MPDPTLDLIARLESATEGSPGLDEAIACNGLGWSYEPGSGRWRDRRGDVVLSGALLPRWTTSIDSALSLVPTGWIWDVTSQTSDGRGGGADLHATDGRETFGTAATPALAVAIAALRAIQAGREVS